MDRFANRCPPLVVGLVLLFGIGCRPREIPTVELRDDVVSRQDLLLVPDFRWTYAGNRWKFNNRGSLVVWTREPSAVALTVTLKPVGEAVHFHFEVQWDGEEIQDLVSEGETGLEITLPPERLTPGRHLLTLSRDYRRDKQRYRKLRENAFEEIRYRHGADPPAGSILDPDQPERHRRIAELLLLGAIGEKEARSGVLFVGPARTDLPLSVEAPTVLSLAPQNFSDADAMFRVAGGEGEILSTLAPDEVGKIEIALGPATRRLTLEVEGAESGLFLWGSPYLRPAGADDLTPIFLITLDTTRRDALDPYSGAKITPHLTRFARRATVYERAYSTAPWTLPSHASIFTGLYPSKHGAGVSEVQLPLDPPTLAERLRRRGYLTAGFSSGALSASRFGLARGFHYYRNPDGFETPGDRVHEYVSAFVERHAAEPLFVFINYFDPHALYQAPAPFSAQLAVPELAEKIRDLPLWGDMVAGDMESWKSLVFEEHESTPEALAWMRAAYLAEVSFTDDLLGRLFSLLKDLGLYDRALIVITADHGELLGEGGMYSHEATLDPELVEIPLLIKWPHQRLGLRRERLTSHVDLFPTILGAVGVEAPPSDGRPLTRPGTRPAAPHPFVLLEEHASLVHPLPERMRISDHLFAVQQPTFRQVVAADHHVCSRRDDGGWTDEPCPAERQTVLAAIEKQLGSRNAGGGDPTAVDEVGDEVREQLTALGYMASSGRGKTDTKPDDQH